MFAGCYVGVLESVLFHKLEEYPVVHPSKCTLEVRVGCVCFFVEILASSYIMMCVERLSYMFIWEPESIGGVAEDPSEFRCLGSYAREDGCP